MNIHFKRPFAQYVKKASRPLRLAIEDAIDLVCESPHRGELKLGDLNGIRVYKFRFNVQEYLVAYRSTEKSSTIEFLTIDFYKVGSHENFYDELKRYVRQERSPKE